MIVYANFQILFTAITIMLLSGIASCANSNELLIGFRITDILVYRPLHHIQAEQTQSSAKYIL